MALMVNIKICYCNEKCVPMQYVQNFLCIAKSIDEDLMTQKSCNCKRIDHCFNDQINCLICVAVFPPWQPCTPCYVTQTIGLASRVLRSLKYGLFNQVKIAVQLLKKLTLNHQSCHLKIALDQLTQLASVHKSHKAMLCCIVRVSTLRYTLRNSTDEQDLLSAHSSLLCAEI